MRERMKRVGERAKALWARASGSWAGRAAVVLVAVLAVGYVLLWWLPKRQVAHLVGAVAAGELFQRENEARQTWAGIIGGLVVLGTLYFTWRRVGATERQVEVAREGQITERFTRAIEQLGSEKLEVRLGGIYALERIARDSEKDHWPIMEVLTAYVRENAARPDEPSEQGRPVTADIQAILTVIGRRRTGFERGLEARLDLRRANLFLSDLRGGRFGRAILTDACLDSANLCGAVLASADLSQALLRRTELSQARLVNAVLELAACTSAHLEGADLRWAQMGGADLRAAVLSEADLRGADFGEMSVLPPASMSNAHLHRARLDGADLRGIDLSEVKGLTQHQIAQAITDDATVLPEYLREEGEKGGE
jgi:uncharacterized protein YjbI with pentapeptide repeats